MWADLLSELHFPCAQCLRSRLHQTLPSLISASTGIWSASESKKILMPFNQELASFPV